MSHDTPQPKPTRLRLCGTVEGVGERRFLLGPGDHRIGSAASNDIVLPVSGVSRLHAVIRVTKNGAQLEDLGSRNGTRLGARPILQGPIAAGDELRLGPVLLQVEAVPEEDAELGLAFEPEATTASTGFTQEDTARLENHQIPASWLALIGSFLSLVSTNPDEALEGLRIQLEARSVAWFEWSEDGQGVPTVIASAGEPLELAERFAFERQDPDPALLTTGTGATETSYWASLLEGRSLVVLAADGLGEPTPQVPQLLALLLSRASETRLAPAAPSPPSTSAHSSGLCFPQGFLPGSSPAMTALFREIASLASDTLPVLIIGETGVGKEPVARTLHASSDRRDKPFVAINCAAIPDELLEAELFGIGKGIATGVRERGGKFVEAEGGVLFLDEVGEIPLPLQAKLLRALQEREIQPLGRPTRRVDVRVISATNRNLAGSDDSTFRRDLYYRLAGYVLRIPALRERPDEIPRLLGHFLRESARQRGKTIRGVTVGALRLLSAYAWPGNVRELEHEARRLALACPDQASIETGMLSQEVQHPPSSSEVASAPSATLLLSEQIEALERRLIQEAMTRSRGNQSQAARLLGISRNGLAKRIRRLDITF